MSRVDEVEILMLTLFCHLFLNSWESPTTFVTVYRCYSHNWLPYYTPGIYVQALRFRGRYENVHVTDGHLGGKCHGFAVKWFGPRMFASWNFLKNQISMTWDTSFHGDVNLHKCLLFLHCHVGTMLTLKWSHSVVLYKARRYLYYRDVKTGYFMYQVILVHHDLMNKQMTWMEE